LKSRLSTTLSTPSVENPAGTPATFCRVAIDTPLRRSFDYLPPEDGPMPTVGMRVTVPFGRQRLIGIIVSLESQSDVDPAKLKRVSGVIDPEPTFDTPLLELLRWATDYYHHPIGEVVATALPKLAREGATLAAISEFWAVDAQGVAAHHAGEPKRAPKQRALLEQLVAGGPAGLAASTLNERQAGWREAARALLARGWIRCEQRAVELAAGSGITTPPDKPELTPAQSAVLTEVQAAGDRGYRGWLSPRARARARDRSHAATCRALRAALPAGHARRPALGPDRRRTARRVATGALGPRAARDRYSLGGIRACA